MRKQMMSSIGHVMDSENNTVLFLADIGVWGFKETLELHKDRAFNIGIFEDGMISVAAGMAIGGFVPFVYGISPFILNRACEQLKLDFCYQELGGNFLTTGAAYDFSTLGYSHYCPEDIEIVRAMPGMEFLAPGTAEEFRQLFDAAWNDGKPTYFRLSDDCNHKSFPVKFGQATILQRGSRATVIACSTMLDIVLEACRGEDVTILYYTTLLPFDRETLRENCSSGKVLLCEDNYEGALLPEVVAALKGRSIRIETIGIPRKIHRTYGKKQEKDRAFGFTVQGIRERLFVLI